MSFVIGYPLFISTTFFVFLWNRPLHLYAPYSLSEDLQKALLPSSLNAEMAPERAAIAALEIKVQRLEKTTSSFPHGAIDSATKEAAGEIGLVVNPDLELLKDALLTRFVQSGELSRESLEQVSHALQTELELEVMYEMKNARESLTGFKDWAVEKGLSSNVSVPEVFYDNNGVAFGPGISESNAISLGRKSKNYLIPGLFIQVLARDEGLQVSFEANTHQLLWTMSEYMAARYLGREFPVDPKGFGVTDFPTTSMIKDEIEKNGFRGSYVEFFSLFRELVSIFGNSAVESGIIHMANNWDDKSKLPELLDLMAKGMAKAGADSGEVRKVFDAYSILSTYNSISAPLVDKVRLKTHLESTGLSR